MKSGYIYGKHYVFFVETVTENDCVEEEIIPRQNSIDLSTNDSIDDTTQTEKKNQDSLYSMCYLTFAGFMRMIETSRSPSIDKYRDWVQKTIFTIQMGTEEEKQDLVKTLLPSQSYSDLKKLYSNDSEIPVVYLCDISSVKEAIEKNLFNNVDLTKYNPNHRVYKYGFAKNFIERMTQEKNKEHKNFVVKYILQRYIDYSYAPNGESYIRDHCVNN